MVPHKFIAIAAVVAAQIVGAVEIEVSASGGNSTSGHQYGFLHEDINNSGDGGVYAELIRNRAFQYSDRYPVSLDAWGAINETSLTLRTMDAPLSIALPYSISVSGSNESSGNIGFYNEGYWGMDVKKQTYTGSFWVKGAYEGAFIASLQSALTDDLFGTAEIQSMARADEWIEHAFELVPTIDAPNSNNTFAISFDPAGATDGSLDFNLISLFPPTYKGRKNGLRIDIADALEGVHPTIFRFPGGNMLEGDTIDTKWDWKESIGPLKDRRGFQGVWGYQQTNGLGLMEYLWWAEDMHMDIIVGVWAGLSLDGGIIPQGDFQAVLDDAMNEIEFIRGPENSTWGSVRASLGHPEPFKLEYVEIGNEDWLAGEPLGWATYQEYRFPMFLEAITTAYPDITVIASGASTDGYDVPSPGIGDYHPYRTPDELVEEFSRFNNDFGHVVGEAAATHPNGGIGWDGGLMRFPWWIGAVGEAISMIGYERNANNVPGAMYAPVLRNMNRWQWAITLIQFAADPAMTTKSTSWYIWEMFAGHTMTTTLPTTADFGPLYYVAGRNEDRDAFIWKGAVYNTTDSADVDVSVKFEGVESGIKAELTILTNPSGDPFAYNDPHTGDNMVESTAVIIKANDEGKFEFTMPELSVAVLDTDTDLWED